MKNTNKIIAGAVALCMVMSNALTVSADTVSTAKEEVIYAMMNADGSVKSVYAVNSFGTGDVIDYGEYSDVKLLNINGAITQSGDKITFSNSSDKAYYQGTLENAELPWNISIRYFLDGTEYTADEIADKSGSLEIQFKITQNENCNDDFYDNYALQAAFTLDTEKCKSISAPDATVANVGSSKQLSYTILAGKGIETSIIADVTNFEMDSVSINGVKLNLSIDIDDDELQSSITELVDGIAELDDGANGLYDGSDELNSGASELYDGIVTLKDGILTAQEGINELDAKSLELVSGSSEVKNALLKIQGSLSEVSANTDKLSELTAASASIKEGIDKLYNGIAQLNGSVDYAQYKAAANAQGLDIDALTQGNEQAISQLIAQIAELKTTLAQIESITQYSQQAAELTAQIAQLENIVNLLSGSNAAINGTESYLNKISSATEQLYVGVTELKKKYAEFDSAINQLATELNAMLINLSALSKGISQLVSEYEKLHGGITEYTNGVAKLCNGFDDIVDGVSALADGGKELSDATAELLNGTSELKDGTGELRDKTSDMDILVSDKIDDVVDEISKPDYETVSFISEKNTDVESVQFVIKTGAIEITEIEVAEQEKSEELTFWQKLLRLFGLY